VAISWVRSCPLPCKRHAGDYTLALAHPHPIILPGSFDTILQEAFSYEP
jgi:hypothetical protein